MPFFKTTHDILTSPWQDELHDDNWFDSPLVTYPATTEWDYSRELQVEDVDVWEVIYQQGGGLGIYAAWSPRAEFYMITHATEIETYYGPDSQATVIRRAAELGIPISLHYAEVPTEDAWKYKGLVVAP